MTHERPTPSSRSNPGTGFRFTEHEQFTWRVSAERSQTLPEDGHTLIHRIELSANNYGEFLFLTLTPPEQVNQPVGEQANVVTFWGTWVSQVSGTLDHHRVVLASRVRSPRTSRADC